RAPPCSAYSARTKASSATRPERGAVPAFGTSLETSGGPWRFKWRFKCPGKFLSPGAAPGVGGPGGGPCWLMGHRYVTSESNDSDTVRRYQPSVPQCGRNPNCVVRNDGSAG